MVFNLLKIKERAKHIRWRRSKRLWKWPENTQTNWNKQEISGKTRFEFCMRKPRCKGINDRKQISRLTNFSSLDFREIVKTRALNTVSFYEGILRLEYTLSRKACVSHPPGWWWVLWTQYSQLVPRCWAALWRISWAGGDCGDYICDCCNYSLDISHPVITVWTHPSSPNYHSWRGTQHWSNYQQLWMKTSNSIRCNGPLGPHYSLLVSYHTELADKFIVIPDWSTKGPILRIFSVIHPNG